MSPLALLLALALAAPLHAASLPAAPLPAAAPRPDQDAIPVAVLLDDVELEPTKLNEVDHEEIQRPTVDLRNPGPPQRQEHETQNPEQHSDESLKESSIRDSIERTRDMLTQSLKETSANVQNWLTSSEDQSSIQKSIQRLRDTFTSQIQKLNNTIHDLINPEEAQQVILDESERKIDVIDSKLKSLKDSFDNGLETLSAGVELAAMLKLNPEDEAEGKEEAETSSTAPASSTPSPQNFVAQFMQNLSNTISTQINTLGSYFQPQAGAAAASGAAPGAQADTPTETQTPGFPIFRPPAVFTGIYNTISNWTQNIPNPIQGLQNWGTQFRPSSTAKPTETANSGSSDPVKTDPSPDKPAADKPGETSTQPQPGPIRQILNSIPVVQRIQSSLANRDTPRQPAAPAAAAAPAVPAAPAAAAAPAVPAAPAPATVEASAQTKGAWYGGPRPGASGDSDDSDRLSERSEEVKEKELIKEEEKESIKEVVKEPIKDEIKKEAEEPKPEPVADKTE